MQYTFLKEKASFMSLVIICAMFSIYLINPVLADDASDTEESMGCCERTSSGESCRYTNVDGCDSTPPFKVGEYQRCEDTTFCKVGCCISPEGSCSKQVSKATCEAAGAEYFWDPNADCTLPRCEKGCCVLGGVECFMSTQKKCSGTTSMYEGLELDFRNIGDEPSCIAVCMQQDDGCCVKDDGSCTRTTRGMCGLDDGSGSIGFYKNSFCSNENLNRLCDPDCVPHAGGRHCVEGSEDVFWFDSCGNREEVVKGEGEIPWSDNEARDGDCDYVRGTLCTEKTDSAHESAYCKDVNCETTKPYTNLEYTQGGPPRKNGESWCYYDTRPGPGLDTVGSRHWKHICINGEEIVEPCKDYREEYCIQMNLLEIPGYGDFSEAGCIENNGEACITDCNTAKEADGDVEKRQAYRNDLKCCQKNSKCAWINQSEPVYSSSGGLFGGSEPVISSWSGEGMCVPLVAKGYEFWGDDEGGVNSDLKAMCDVIDAGDECNTWWEMPFAGGYWECKSRCKCYTNEYFDTRHKLCNAMGDCGADYNYVGTWTKDGITRDWYGDAEGTPKTEITDPGNFEEAVKKVPGFGFGVELKWSDITTGELAMSDAAAASIEIAGFVAIGGAITTIVLASMTAAGVGIGGAAALSGLLGTAGTLGTALAGAEVGMGAVGGIAGAAMAGVAAAIAAIITFATAFATNDKTSMYVAAGTGLGGAALIGILIGVGAMSGPVGWIAAGVAAVIGLIALILSFLGEDEYRQVTIDCEPWSAPIGGNNRICGQCDEDPMHVCSEYRCRSLGQNCRFIAENEGSGRETCYAQINNDVSKPKIFTWPDDNKPIHVWKREDGERKDKREEYSLNPVRLGEGIENGYEIKGTGENVKLPSFSTIEFGIRTDEPAQCKWSTTFNNKPTFASMEHEFGNIYYTKEHNMSYSTLPNSTYKFYVICRDHNGNPKEDEIMPNVFVIQFETGDGPDLEVPYIYGTEPATGGYVKAGENSTLLTIYIDEVTRTRCKYSNADVDYYLMNNFIGCEAYGEGVFSPYRECNTMINITQGANTFYIRCADNQRDDLEARGPEINIMDESYAVTLTQSEPLLINNIVPPAGTVYYTRNVTLQVLTENGAFGGRAICSYEEPDMGFGDRFDETNSTQHMQELYGLLKGKYKISVHCFDDVGNEAFGETNFSVEADLAAPNVIALYKDAAGLHLTLDEKASCEYSSSSFTFGEGTEVSTDSETVVLPIGSREYHIRCMDSFGNIMPEIVVKTD